MNIKKTWLSKTTNKHLFVLYLKYYFNLKIITIMNKVKASLLALSILLSISLSAQKLDVPKAVKQHEIGLSANVASLSQMSFLYRIGQPKAMWRFGFVNVTNSHQIKKDQASQSIFNNINIGIGLGKECRKLVNETFEFRVGADITFNYASSLSKSEDNSVNENSKSYSQRYRPGINAVLGFNYLINKHLIIGAEVLPKVEYSITTTTRENDLGRTRLPDSKGFTAQLSNQSVLLSLAYRL